MIHICEHCNSKFSNKSNLINHIKNAQFCLKIRKEKEEELKYKTKEEELRTCTGCEEIFSNVYSLNRHKLHCLQFLLKDQEGKYKKHIKDQEDKYEKRLKDQEDKYLKLLKEKDELIERMIKDRESLNEKMVDKLAIRERSNKINVTSNNNSNNVNLNLQLIQLTDENIIKRSRNLNTSHVNNVENFGKYLNNNIFKNSILLTDKSRGKMLYINENGKEINDSVLNILSRILTPISDKIDDVTLELIYRYKHMCGGSCLADEVILLNSTIQRLVLKDNLEENHQKISKEIVSVICNTAEGKKQYCMFKDELKEIENTMDIENVTEFDEIEEDIIKKQEREKRLKYFKVYRRIEHLIPNLQDFYDDEETGYQYERVKNNQLHIERIYGKIGDFYFDENENVIHPVCFYTDTKPVITDVLSKSETRTLQELIETGELTHPDDNRIYDVWNKEKWKKIREYVKPVYSDTENDEDCNEETLKEKGYIKVDFIDKNNKRECMYVREKRGKWFDVQGYKISEKRIDFEAYKELD